MCVLGKSYVPPISKIFWWKTLFKITMGVKSVIWILTLNQTTVRADTSSLTSFAALMFLCSHGFRLFFHPSWLAVFSKCGWRCPGALRPSQGVQQAGAIYSHPLTSTRGVFHRLPDTWYCNRLNAEGESPFKRFICKDKKYCHSSQ